MLLLHANEFVSRERLIDELWGAAPPPTASKAVNVYLSKLRKALTRETARIRSRPRPAVTGSPSSPDQLDAARAQHLVATRARAYGRR